MDIINRNCFDNELLNALTQEHSAIQEIEQEKEENSLPEETAFAPTLRQKLWRDTQKEALTWLEDSARTENNFRNVQLWWDRFDANADRRYRYHVIGRSDVLLEWGAAPEQAIILEPIQHIFWKQIIKGDFLNVIFEGKGTHKEVLYYSAIRQYFNQRIARIRSQTDCNILKVKNTILKKLRKKGYLALCERQEMKMSLSQREKEFLDKYLPGFSDKGRSNADASKIKNNVVIDDI